MNKVNQQMKKARQAGMSTIDVARMRAIAKKQAEQMESKAIEEAFLAMLAIPLNILIYDYWPKTGKKRAPKFIEDVLSLFESWELGIVTSEQLTDFLKEYAGITIEDAVSEYKKKKEINE